MNAKTAKTVKNLVDLHHRDVVCDNELFTFVVEEAEREFLSEYISLLPSTLAARLPEWMDSQSKLDSEWASFYLPQLDGPFAASPVSGPGFYGVTTVKEDNRSVYRVGCSRRL